HAELARRALVGRVRRVARAAAGGRAGALGGGGFARPRRGGGATGALRARARAPGASGYDRQRMTSSEGTASSAPPPGARGANASLRILVVDDESDLPEMLTRSSS